MNKKTMVSIIVLTYNHEKYISQALESILMQKVDFDYEILIGDDCSTDRTSEILKEYQEKYPDKIYLRLRHKNIGAAKNAYELYNNAIGKYLAHLDGDDYWTNEKKLQLQVDFLEKNVNYIGCSHRCNIVDEDGNFIKKTVPWIKYKSIFTLKDFEGYYLPGHVDSYVRKNIYIDSDEDFSIMYKINPQISDRTAMLVYLSKGDFYCFDKWMSSYRQNVNTSITNQIYGGKNNKVYLLDLGMNNLLKKYAVEKLDITVDFSKREYEIWLNGVIAFIKKPSENISFYKCFDSEKRFKYLILTPYGITKRVINKIRTRFIK